MLRFAVCGAGRIGRVHAANIAVHPRAELAWVLDVDAEAAASLARALNARSGVQLKEALDDIDAVVIASPTPTHVELITEAAQADKAIFCEKPIDLDLDHVDDVAERVQLAGVPFLVGFNRRFDPNFVKLKAKLDNGEVGRLELLSITSRDPSPPPPVYIQSSGGLFRDMMIHDFDMARWLVGEDPCEVYATASNLVDPSIGAVGDVDTAIVIMKAQSGALIHISNSRRATYGYDQRIEAFGSNGMLLAENQLESNVIRYDAKGIVADKPKHFFLERYQAAYRAELDHFVDEALSMKPSLRVGIQDGRQALALAEAAIESLDRGAPVPFGAL